MYAESVNNADVSILSIGGGRGTIDVITSSTGTASGCGNAADVITSSLDGTGGRGTIDVIANCVPAVAGRKRGNTCAGSDTTAVGRRDGVSGAADG